MTSFDTSENKGVRGKWQGVARRQAHNVLHAIFGISQESNGQRQYQAGRLVETCMKAKEVMKTQVNSQGNAAISGISVKFQALLNPSTRPRSTVGFETFVRDIEEFLCHSSQKVFSEILLTLTFICHFSNWIYIIEKPITTR
jgi:hypothetical protein